MINSCSQYGCRIQDEGKEQRSILYMSAASHKIIRNTGKPSKRQPIQARSLFIRHCHIVHTTAVGLSVTSVCYDICAPIYTFQLVNLTLTVNLASKLYGLITALQMTRILLNGAISIQGKEFVRHVAGNSQPF